MKHVVPAIIPESFAHLAALVERVAGAAERVQIDVLDGVYTPEKSWPQSPSEADFEALTSGAKRLPHQGQIGYEIDLMVRDPERHIESWIAAGAQAIIVHLESSADPAALLRTIKARGCEAALAIRPSTPLESLEPLLAHVDFVQLMGSDTIGFHGVTLDPRVVGRAERLRESHPELIIAVDIGVSAATAPALVKAGVRKLVSGSAIFDAPDPREAIEALERLF